jgi:uncharacterized membrane protein YeaQ/YmgE (transglycosylase-associated protein family)
MEDLKMCKEITMTINQFMEIERGNLTFKEIKQSNDLELMAGKILKNKKLTRFVVTTTSLICISLKASANENTAQAVAQIQSAENQIIPVILAVIGAICTIACIAEIGKSLITKKGSDIGQIIMKYILAFAGACAVPWIFRIIRGMFKL